MLVTISGLPGVGTTTVGRALAGRLKLPYCSSGDIFREQARAAGMTLAEYDSKAEHGPSIDRALDEAMLEEARLGDRVLEGRLTGWITRREGVEALRVWLAAPLEVRLDRIAGREGRRADGLRERVVTREGSEGERYLKYYDIDIKDMEPYDLVLDTSHNSPSELVERIVAELARRGWEVAP